MSEPEANLGVVVLPHGLEAALALPNAEGAFLCLYDGDREVFRAAMNRDDGGVVSRSRAGFRRGRALRLPGSGTL